MKTSKSYFKKLLLIAMIAIAIVSCEKDNLSKSEILTDGKWIATALTADPAIDWFGTPVTNVFSQMPACSKDDVSVFKTNGDLLNDEGSSKCNASDPQTTTSKWVLNPAETVITITQDGQTTSWDISSIAESSMTVIYRIKENNTNYTFNMTLSKVK